MYACAHASMLLRGDGSAKNAKAHVNACVHPRAYVSSRARDCVCVCVCVLQVINAYRKANKKMDEPLVMFYATELLRAVEAMHAAGVLHGDIKPDNILIRDDDSSDSSWLYAPSQGFGAKGVELIDYGCAIDRNMYPEDTVFVGRRFVLCVSACDCTDTQTWWSILQMSVWVSI